MAPERILITGYSGFVGKHLIPLFRKHFAGAELVGLSHLPAPVDGAFSGLTTIQSDLRERDAIRVVIADRRPDLIIHLAGQASVAESWKYPEDTLAINAGGTVNLLEAVHAAGLSTRILLIGSAEQYGIVAPEDNPIRESQPMLPVNPYAVSKVTQDLLGYQYYAAYGLPIVRVRAFNHFGPSQPNSYVIANFARQLALIEAGYADPVVYVGNLAVQRDFLPVTEVTRAYLALIEHGHAGEAYNVGSGMPVSTQQILDILRSLTSAEVAVQVDPERLRPADVPVAYADITHLCQDTNWKPTWSLEESLREVLEFWRRQVRLQPERR